MRARTFGAFIAGFVGGMAVLAVVLWFNGALNLPRALARTPSAAAPGSSAPAPPVDTSMPNLASAPKAPPLVPSPSELPQTVSPAPRSGTQGEAERSVPEADTDRPIIPVQGVPANKIKDTFYDNRDGHEHDALDIPAARDTPVVAAVEGNVAKLFHSQQGGTTVYQFDDSGKFCYYYAHLDHYAPGLKEGTLLRQGQVLGYVGTSGNAPSSAPHLHFAIFRVGADKSWWKGTAIDPVPLLH